MSVRTIAACAVVCTLAGPAMAAKIRVPQDQPTIQAAVDAAADGDTIVVARGTYTESVVIASRSGLRLVGKKGARLDGGGGSAPLLAVRGSSDVSVRGFEFAGSTADLVQVADSTIVTVTRCSFHDGGANGISCDGVTRLEVVRNAFDDLGLDAVTDEPGEEPVASSLVSRNRISNCREDGVQVRGGENTISRNGIVGVSDDGIQIEGAAAAQCTIERNTIAEAGRHAIAVFEGAHENAVLRNRVRSAGSGGIYVEGDVTEIQRNAVADCDIGIWLLGDSNTPLRNKVVGVDTEGFQVNGRSNVLISNTVIGAGDDAYDVEGVLCSLAGNLAQRSGDHGFEVNGTRNTLEGNVAKASTNAGLYDDSLTGTNEYVDNRFGSEEILEP